jgi:hypothetical protein
MEAAIETAAERPPVMARCMPDEKNGSMKAANEEFTNRLTARYQR